MNIRMFTPTCASYNSYFSSYSYLLLPHSYFAHVHATRSYYCLRAISNTQYMGKVLAIRLVRHLLAKSLLPPIKEHISVLYTTQLAS